MCMLLIVFKKMESVHGTGYIGALEFIGDTHRCFCQLDQFYQRCFLRVRRIVLFLKICLDIIFLFLET